MVVHIRHLKPEFVLSSQAHVVYSTLSKRLVRLADVMNTHEARGSRTIMYHSNKIAKEQESKESEYKWKIPLPLFASLQDPQQTERERERERERDSCPFSQTCGHGFREERRRKPA